jgi:hypothetical protein
MWCAQKFVPPQASVRVHEEMRGTRAFALKSMVYVSGEWFDLPLLTHASFMTRETTCSEEVGCIMSRLYQQRAPEGLRGWNVLESSPKVV